MYKVLQGEIGWAVFKQATGFWQQISKEYVYVGNALRKLKEVERNGNKSL